MKVQVLIKVEISNINIDDVMKEFPTLRMYLQWFQRTSNGMFISKAEVYRIRLSSIAMKTKCSMRTQSIIIACSWGTTAIRRNTVLYAVRCQISKGI